MKIGIPRALVYWKRPHFWETFFARLGFEVLLSPATNKEIVEAGVKWADPETCFANKIFWGHVLWLENKVDLIFIPRLKVTKERLEYCPKFFGLPDLAKILVKTPILTETFDERKEKFLKTLERLGKKLKRKPGEVKKAQKAALLAEKSLKKGQREVFSKNIDLKKKKIVLISHPYNLYDEYVNLRLKEKLERLGVQVIFGEEIPIKSQKSVGPKFHWEFGQKILGQTRAVSEYKISGAVEISSFQCGCDAVLKEFVEKEFRQKKTPFLYLLIDEHTGEAGLQTRLEAFTDTL